MTDVDYMARVQAMERKLYRVAHALLWNDADCADAIQEAVVKGWLKRDSLRNPEWLETWLTRILINECHNIQRKSRIKLLPLDEQIGLTDSSDFVEDVQLRDALRRLPEKYRLPLVMRCALDMSYDEIARALRIPRGAVKWRVEQGKKRVRREAER